MGPPDQAVTGTMLVWEQLEHLLDVVDRHRALFRRAARISRDEWAMLSRLHTAPTATSTVAALAAALLLPPDAARRVVDGLVASGRATTSSGPHGRSSVGITPRARAELRLHQQLLASVADPALGPIAIRAGAFAAAIEAVAVELDHFRQQLGTSPPSSSTDADAHAGARA